MADGERWVVVGKDERDRIDMLLERWMEPTLLMVPRWKAEEPCWRRVYWMDDRCEQLLKPMLRNSWLEGVDRVQT